MVTSPRGRGAPSRAACPQVRGLGGRVQGHLGRGPRATLTVTHRRTLYRVRVDTRLSATSRLAGRVRIRFETNSTEPGRARLHADARAA